MYLGIRYNHSSHSFVNIFLTHLYCGTSIILYNIHYYFFYPRPKCIRLDLYKDNDNIFTHIVLRNHAYELWQYVLMSSYVFK